MSTGESNGPVPWSLEGEDAPEPQTEDPTVTDKEPDEIGLPTHTGTDPYGRAIGPAEDHTEPKLDSEGRTANEAGAGVDTGDPEHTDDDPEPFLEEDDDDDTDKEESDPR